MSFSFKISKPGKDSSMNDDQFLRKYCTMDRSEKVLVFGSLFCLAFLICLLLIFATGCVTVGRSASTTSSQTTTPNISLSIVHIGDMQTTSGTEDTDSRQESNAQLQDTLKDLLKADVPIDHLDVGGVGGGVSKGVSSAKEKVGSRPEIPSIRKDSDDEEGDGELPGDSGDQTFLWKPKSERSALVILLPAKYNSSASSVTVNGEQLDETSRVEHGKFPNGNRRHFRSGKEGSAFGSNVKVTISFKDGSSRVITIPNGGDRFTSRA